MGNRPKAVPEPDVSSRRMHAMSFPSGDIEALSAGLLVNCTGCPLSIATFQRVDAPDLRDSKTIHFPSGEKVGASSIPPAFVICFRLLPSISIRQIFGLPDRFDENAM